MRVIRLLVALSLLVAICVTTSAQTDFERMAANLHEASIPLVNLRIGDPSAVSNEFSPAEIEIVDREARTNGSKHFKARCLVRHRGASSTRYPKKSFAIKLIDNSGEDLDVSVLGIRKENSWILDAMSGDRLRMRNKLCFDLWNSFSSTPYDTKYDNRNGIEAHHVELFINGAYHGIYCLSDKVDRKLLGLKKAKEDGDEVTIRGLLYKCVTWGFGSTLMYRHQAITPDFSQTTWEAYELKLPEEHPGREAWIALYELIGYYQNAFSRYEFLHKFTKSFYRQNVLDYLALCAFLNLRDNMMKNTYLSVVDKTVEERFLITPWDMDTSLSNEWDGSYNNDVVSDLHSFMERCAPYEALRFDNSFLRERDALFDSLATSTLSLESVAARMADIARPLIRSGAWERETTRWGGATVPLAPNLMDEVRTILSWYQSNLAALGFEQPMPMVEDEEVFVPAERPEQEEILYDLAGRRVWRTVGRQLYVSSRHGLVLLKSMQNCANLQ